MSGLQLAIGESTLAGFILAVARTAGFVLTAPPFNTRGLSVRVRASVAVVLAFPLTVWMAPAAPSLDSTDLLLAVILQVVAGAALGFLVLVAVAMLQAVGDLIDLVGGFSLSMAMDPMMMTQTSVMGRLHQLLAITLLFATDAHLMVLHGLSRSVQLMPIPELDLGEFAALLTTNVAGLIAGALQVAGPIVAVMLIADLALGLLTRAAPALNAFALGFPLKILLTLVLVGLVIVQLPGVLSGRVENAVVTMLGISGG